MELDFATVKALSSPTRIRILSLVMDRERTPTDLAQDLGKSKSTVSDHLSTLVDAGLVERDAEEGRRRVMYAASRKAEAIVKGKERRVTFSVASSAATGLAGIYLIGSRLVHGATTETAAMMAAQAEGGAATEAARSGGALLPEGVVIGVGVLALVAAMAAGMYALVLHRLPDAP